MRRFIVGLFALIGLLTVLVAIAVAVLASRLTSVGTQAKLPDTIVLAVDLTQGLAEGPGPDTLTRLVSGDKPSLRDFLDALERGAGDPRVKGLYAPLGDDSLGLARTQEVRDAVAAFRAQGKFAIAFADSFGEFGPGSRPYYLATAFDEIWLQPMGLVGLTGLYAEVPFFKGTLDLLGITPDFDRRSEFKTAMNTLTETRMTPPHREEVDALIGSMAGQIVRGIAEARKLSEAEVRAVIDRGPLFAEEAREARLVDRLGYRDEAVARARERAGSGADPVSLTSYLDGAGRPHASGPAIALIYGTGLIERGAGSARLIGTETGMSAREITRAFREAERDSDVHAILFRIDSPGGSVVASETIWREIGRARERGKPVVVSMGDLAGSGGYYIAAPADKIVAEPATLTGSIGVVAGKAAVGGLLEKLGITVDHAQFGANAGMFDPTSQFSPQAHQRLETFLDLIYQGFKDHVAAGRHLSADQVEAAAKGRVWSGEDAKARGLVDELGGYAAALRLAKEAANLAPDAAFKLVTFPREQGPGEIIYNRILHRERELDDAAGAGAMLPAVLPALGQQGVALPGFGFAPRVMQRLQALARDPALLLMPELGDIR
ncbi:MAG: signal peptide peptidase SppA [Alphaproteobacteria bacterium]|nr:signal peptide peptidase SppA [Alphaproteobacteria bacterium]